MEHQLLAAHVTRIAMYNFDAAEALATILKHEGVGFTKGVGRGYVTIDIASADYHRMMTLLCQWEVALYRVFDSVKDLPAEQKE